MMVPKFMFLVAHAANGPLVALSYPKKHRMPVCMLSTFSCIPEHYADVIPSLAPLGPAVTGLVFLSMCMHYYFAYNLIDKQVVLTGLAANVALTMLAFGSGFGIPKDTVPEHIEELSDETWVMQHFVLQIAFLLVFAVTAIPLAKEKEGSEEPASKVIYKDFIWGGIPLLGRVKEHPKKTAKAA